MSGRRISLWETLLQVNSTTWSRRLLRLFVELHKLGTSVLIATHDVALMDQVDAPRLVLNHGEIEIYG